MNFDKEPEIEVWDIRKPTDLDKIKIEIVAPEKQISLDYQKMIDEKWQDFLKHNPKAFDGAAFYLIDYENLADDGIRCAAERRVFSINQAFNRGRGLPNGRQMSTKFGAASIFTNTLYLLTRDGKDGGWSVLYGENPRYDPKNKLADNYLIHSVAGGIANASDLTEDGKRLDLNKFFRRKVLDETGNRAYLDYMTKMYACGLTYRDPLPNRGFDLVGVVETSLETEKALELFRSNPNFRKKPVGVKLTVPDLCNFFNPDRIDVCSWTSIASSYIVMNSLNGPDAAQEVLKYIQANWRSYIKILDPLLPQRAGGKIYDILNKRDYSD